MTRFGWVMATYFSAVATTDTALFNPAPRLIWNASASVPLGLYAVRPAGACAIDRLWPSCRRSRSPASSMRRGYLPAACP